jgi:hypothetical protein
VPFRFALAPSGQPNNSSTSTHKGAEPSSAQVSHDSHSPLHAPTHTYSPSVTLTWHTTTYAFIHSLTYSLIHSFTLPNHAFPHKLTAFTRPRASRGAKNDRKLATHVVGWHMSLVSSPILSSPASLERKTCRQPTQQVVV